MWVVVRGAAQHTCVPNLVLHLMTCMLPADSACGFAVLLTCIHQHSLTSQLEFLVGAPAECMFDSSCIRAVRLFAGGVVMLSAFLCTG